MSKSVDDSEVFVETTILVDFAQTGGESPGYTLFGSRDCEKVASPYVREEYERKKENRGHIVEAFQRQVGSGEADFDELTIPHDEHLSPQDVDYARALLTELAESENAREANLELARRRTRFRKVHRLLLGDGGLLTLYLADLDVHLLGNLRGPVENRDDARVLAEAADWADTRDKETVLSMDRRDIIDNEDEINDVIDLTRGFDCELAIYHISDFLEATERDE